MRKERAQRVCVSGPCSLPVLAERRRLCASFPENCFEHAHTFTAGSASAVGAAAVIVASGPSP